MNTSRRYSPEVRERAVRMVLEQQTEHNSQWATIQSILFDLKCHEEIQIFRTLMCIPKILSHSGRHAEGAKKKICARFKEKVKTTIILLEVFICGSASDTARCR